MKMGTIIILLQLQLMLLNWALSVEAESCPFDLDYVRQLPWDRSYCETHFNKSGCCQALRSLLGVGLSQYLKEESVFEFPDNATALSCLRTYQQELDSLSLPEDLVENCFVQNISDFVSSPELCAGIQYKHEWISKVKNTSLDSACKGDISELGACELCQQSGKAVTSKLAARYNSSISEETTSKKCFYFVCLYPAGVVNEFGPMDRNTAECILAVPFVPPNSDRRAFAYAFISIAMVFVFLCALGLLYYLLVTRIDPKAMHRRFVKRNQKLLKAAVKPNTGAMWFDIRIIRNATDNFSEANLIGRGGFATVYRGTLPNARRIAVKRIRNCTPRGIPNSSTKWRSSTASGNGIWLF